GALALARGEAAEALPLLREAHRLWARVHAPYEVARARVDAGRACADLGDTDGARVEWLVAQHAFAALGARPDEQRTNRLLGLAAGPDGLTPRELQVLGLVAAGLTNPQIASSLYLSEKTVSRHLGNIFTKLGVRSRTAAAAYAYRHHLG
ncbi:helix-turn-helix transcriptional regulator, partial [Ornithinicoccus halotolerans]|uniref:helix-turn-helix transcriptional regulator n=1 Tax=Ornithinicoccus halotolerans TaxID=1748220 RepID=UPI00188640AC